MKQTGLIVGAIAIVAAGTVYFAMQRSSDDKPTPIKVATAPAPVTPAPEPIKEQPSVTATQIPPTEPSKPLPPAIAKVEAAARQTPLNRPMTEVAKSWFGCNSEDAYNATLALLTHNDPASAERFKGNAAPCMPLQAGRQIKVVDIDTSNNVAHIRLADTHEMVFTDAAALSGHGQHGDESTTPHQPG